MAKEGRKIIALNEETGERLEYDAAYRLASRLGVQQRSVMQALERNGCVKGWRVYDSPDRIRRRIKELEEQIKMLEG